ncbi:uncharacterized protein LOC135486749 [Lineus longissimus]|uniref:uncharacterized protein LOC135486749 n=1 Tax=Lineus longissimus TaxID=88925 RepID=UPI00315DBFF4
MRYDFHIFVDELAKQAAQEKVSFRIIPKTKENYHAMYYDGGQFKFIDSFHFLSSSLATLAHSIHTGKDGEDIQFKLLFAYVNENKELYNLVKAKSAFCYDFLDSEQKLELEELPAKAEFFNSLENSEISDEMYQRAQKVWSIMGMKSLKDYLTLYLHCDTLILAEIFENFRNVSMKNFTLDPCHFVSTPSFSFHCMLRHTGVKLDLLQDMEMVNFLRSGVRGGVSGVMKREVHRNMPDMSDYRPNMLKCEIVNLDCCSMYSFCLRSHLPVGDFRWLSDTEMKEFDLHSVAKGGDQGFILSVDLDYPTHLHDLHNDLPLAPEHYQISPADWSPYAHEVAADLELTIRKASKKLVPHLGPRRSYVIHHETLRTYLKLGLVLVKTHRILTFTKSKFMESYIDFNTQQRQMAKSEFEISFYKLMNNSVYGKLLQDSSKFTNFQLVSTSKKILKLTSKINFKSVTIFNSSLAGIELKPTTVLINQPIAVGFACLDLAKNHLYKMHYNFVMKLFGSDCELIYRDTDSLYYAISNRDEPCEDLFRFKRYFDLSNLPKSSPFYCETNHRRPGAFKHESPLDRVSDFVGLRSKMARLH